jgi:hypothetical protein
MIYFVNLNVDITPTIKFIERFGFTDLLRVIYYEDLFTTRLAPIGHYVFREFDRLRPYERVVADHIARAVKAAAPDALILNRPALVRERYPLLRALFDTGINSFDAVRLDEGRRPERYPVFLRREDEYFGAESELIHSDAEFDIAVAVLEARGVPLRGWIAVGWRAERGADGRYRKYGIMRVGNHLIPAHIHFGPHWVVKRTLGPMAPGDLAEEFTYVRDNPHRDTVMRAFEVARMEFGRMDYGIVDGRIEVYEINSNPIMPTGSRNPERAERTALVKERMWQAFGEIARVRLPRGRVAFDLPDPKFEPFPGGTLPQRFQRRVARLHDRISRRFGK